MGEWRTIDSAPKGALVILLCGETIPDHPQIYVGKFYSGDDMEKVGYRELAKYGGWIIWNSEDNWFALDTAEPTHWMPLPNPPEGV